MSVSVSLVTHASRAHLDACLNSVRAQGPRVCEVLAVDAASQDGSVEHLRRVHRDVRLEALGWNAGYAVAHNRNRARARGRYLLVLNPDVVLMPGYVDALACRLDADSSLGAAVGRLVEPGPLRRTDSAGIVRGPGRVRFLDRGRGAPPGRYAVEEDVFGACGAAALYRVQALDSVSRPGEAPFAERFFMYYEDVDLAWRLRRAGWRTRYVPQAEALHRRGGSGAGSAFVEYHLVRNRLWLTLRNARLRELPAELPGLALFEGMKLAQAALRPHLRAALRDQWRGVRCCLRERRRGARGA